MAATTLTRSELKRRSIIEVATRLFLDKGYQGTSMDEIAAGAAVSKQTVYKQFRDKDQLFSGIVHSITERAEEITRTFSHSIEAVENLEADLTSIAIAYATGVVSPDVIRLRRLVIAEAVRFPELATFYFAEAPKRALAAVSHGLAGLVERELLAIDDFDLAAIQFAYLVLGPLIDQALFLPETRIAPERIRYLAEAGVRTFLQTYARKR
jgi:TetR/AcrR family transcriptional regulator, mexJK operon transcriptional repressor